MDRREIITGRGNKRYGSRGITHPVNNHATPTYHIITPLSQHDIEKSRS